MPRTIWFCTWRQRGGGIQDQGVPGVFSQPDWEAGVTVAATGSGGDREVIHPLPQVYANSSQSLLLATLSLRSINLRWADTA